MANKTPAHTNQWSPQQDRALKAVEKWLKNDKQQVFKLFGYAGTGKTFIAKEMANLVRRNVLFGAFTGKAALVLRSKGCYNASTIHSMIYKVDEDRETGEPMFKIDPMSSVRTAGLVIIDECSMCSEELALDLLSFGTKVLVLGDPAQLPPVKGAGFFTVGEPDFMLTEVHRQAKDNPIIAMSMIVREGGELKHGDYGSSRVVGPGVVSIKQALAADQVLVGLNRTRQSTNRRMRELLGRANEMPEPGDKIVCLKNDKELRLLNGGLWKINAIRPSFADYAVGLRIVPEDGDENSPMTDVVVRKEFFLGTDDKLDFRQKKFFNEFTYGYSLTVHKSQGSQWNNIIVFDESGSFREDRAKHLYTALTRAAEKVTVVK